jgi:hypothetical protein
MILPVKPSTTDFFHKVCAKWFPELLEQHWYNPLGICNNLLKQYHEEGDTFLSHIVTGDNFGPPQAGKQVVQYALETPSVQKKFRSQ